MMTNVFGGILLIFGLIQTVESGVHAIANLHLDSSPSGAGSVFLDQPAANAPVRLMGVLIGFQPHTVHGLHVHRDPLPNGVLNCTAAGPHYNPYNVGHGPREADLMNRHVGDLGNVTADENGIISVEIADRILDFFNSTLSVGNRTLVLHAIRDDGGKGGFPDSNTTGDAGARIACGVINLLDLSNKKTERNPPIYENFFKKLFF